MKLTRIVLLGAVAVLLLTGSDSFAGAEKGQGDAVTAAFKARFNLIDANGDGKVTREEYLEFHRKRAETVFNRLDKNKKGYVTKEEVQQLAEEASTKAKKSSEKWREAQQQWQQKRQEQLEQQQQQQQQQQ